MNIICIICKETFFTYHHKKQKFCSMKCLSEDARLKRIALFDSIIKNCMNCNKSFHPKTMHLHNVQKYCSKKCYHMALKKIHPGKFWEIATKEEKLIRLKQNYEKHVIRIDKSCWKWKGNLGREGGYGCLMYGKKKYISSNRASWMIHFGEIPINMLVCHKCDNPECTNPDHLFLGTHQDNSEDMDNKGRRNTVRGSKTGTAKLNEKQVYEIKKELIIDSSRKNILKLAIKYNISEGSIYGIKNNRNWNHIILKD